MLDDFRLDQYKQAINALDRFRAELKMYEDYAKLDPQTELIMAFDNEKQTAEEDLDPIVL